MTMLQDMSRDDLRRREEDLMHQHGALRGRNWNIDMIRGKPTAAQLDLSNGLFEMVTAANHLGVNDEDYRYYGAQSGTPEAKAFFAECLGVGAAPVSSARSRAMTAISKSVKPWALI